MHNDFILESQDLGDNQRLMCRILSHVVGKRDKSDYILVQINPPIDIHFSDRPNMCADQVILSAIGNYSWENIGSKYFMVEIAMCPKYISGVIDEKNCVKIGTGTIISQNK